MPHRETVKETVTPATARKAAVGATVTALLCLLAAGSLPPTARAQQLPAQPNAVRQQLGQAALGAAQARPAPAPAKPGDTKPVAAPPRPTAEGPDTNAGKQAGAAKSDAPQKTVARRDPFSPLLNNPNKVAALPEHLPPGIAGLVIATLHVDGIVSGPNGMIAIVSNPQQRVYFLREGDRLYDGSVQHIGLDMIAFHETGKDPFGKPVDRLVSKMLFNVTPGEEAP